MDNTNQEVGFVKSIKDFLVYLDGLPTVRINDLVENEQGVRGLVSAVLPDEVEVLLLDDGLVAPNQLFKRSGQKLTAPVGQFLMGRAVNPLGIPIDGKGSLSKTQASESLELDQPAKGVSQREFIKNQLDTGITVVDTLIPIGKGQRELVLGDARSGKTSFLVDLIINQKNTKVVCIYAAIGKPIAEIRSLIDILQVNQAFDHTIVVAASSADPAPLIFLTPQTAFTIAEYFAGMGQDVLLILDDMGNHAKIYREISLLGDRSPGRESYPGDIFYQHAHLLERGGYFKNGGSITAFPVIELNLGDFTTFIPTNLMSMTDGHLLFRSALYNQGQHPAIDISLSVSRVGQQTQNRLHNHLNTRIKQILAQAGQLETVSRFSFELPLATQLILKQKGVIDDILQQPPLESVSKEMQTVLLAIPFTKYFQKKDKDFMKENRKKIIESLTKDADLASLVKSVFTISSEQELFDKIDSLSQKFDQFIPDNEDKPAATPPATDTVLSSSQNGENKTSGENSQSEQANQKLENNQQLNEQTAKPEGLVEKITHMLPHQEDKPQPVGQPEEPVAPAQPTPQPVKEEVEPATPEVPSPSDIAPQAEPTAEAAQPEANDKKEDKS